MIYKKLKRSLDLFFSLIALLLSIPIWIIIAILIKIEDNGPVLFSQIRVGLNGKCFMVYKFRSMKYQKNKITSKGDVYFNEDLKSARLRYKDTKINDQRITKVGKFIRSTHIDEIPQFLNIIKNEMSFVGPRPDVPAQQGDYTISDWLARISVKPGLTGLAQVSKISNLSDKIRYDNKYVKNITLKKDLIILIKTIFKFLINPSF